MLAWIGAASISLAVTPWGYRQLGSYDLSPMIDFAWRYQQGQTPGADFPATLPASFMAAVRSTTVLGASSWTELLAVGVLITIVSTLAVLYFLAKAGVRNAMMLVLAALSMIIPWIATNHLWHSSLTAQLASASVVIAVAVARNPNRWSALLLGVTMALTLVSKPNVGWVVVLGITVLLMFSTGRRIQVHVVIGLVVSYCLVIVSAGVSLAYPFTTTLGFLDERNEQLMVVPPGSADLNGLLLFFVPWVALPLLMLVVASVSCWTERVRSSGVQPTLFGAVAAGLAWFTGIVTNWDSHWNDFPLAGIAVVLLVAYSSERDRSPRTRTILTFSSVVVCIVLLAVSMGEGASRLRMRYVGPLFEEGSLTAVENGFLEGLELGSTGTGVVEAQEASNTRWCGDDARIVFGPRLEFLYAQWKIASPKGLPLWWHSGSSYSIRNDLSGILDTIDARPIQFVSLGDDFTRLPDQVTAELSRAPIVGAVGPLRVRCLS